MNRRKALKILGTSFGALTGAGLLGRYAFLSPSPSDKLESVHTLAIRLFDSLDSEIRKRVCVDYDHPLRQYHNRGVRGGGLAITGWSFNREQRQTLTDLLYAGLSEQGRDRLPNEFFIKWPGVHLMNILICGDPNTSPYQLILTGPHLNLRLGGRSVEGVAFGGPLVYGDQRGNFRKGLPGNLYQYQFQIAHRLYESLDSRQKQVALLRYAPIQTQIELQGRDGNFPGIAVATLTASSRKIAGELLRGMLSTYAPEDVEYAEKCLEENGGIDSMHLSYYEEGEDGRSGECQIFRLEGPAAVLYFRGHPHVHAFINIGMNPDAPLSVGEPLGENPTVMEAPRVRQLFENAMKHHAGTDFAYYEDESVVGRLRTGLIRTGDIYTLESWQDTLTIVEIRGADIRGSLLERHRSLGVDPSPGRTYTVATSTYTAEEQAASALGSVASRRRGIMLRDAVIAYVKQRGFSG